MEIYYFTRSGRSKQIAEELAYRYGVTAKRIDDGKNWKGPLGFLKAGYMSSRGKSLAASYERPTEGETVALVFPLWANQLPPAVKTFATEVGREHIICIPTSMGSTLTDRDGFIKVIDLVGKVISPPAEL
jgi:hypothetical protein